MQDPKDIDKFIEDWEADEFQGNQSDFTASVLNKIESRRSARRFNKRLLQMAASLLIVLNISMLFPLTNTEDSNTKEFESEYFQDYSLDFYSYTPEKINDE